MNHRVVLREALLRQLADHLLSGLRRGGLQEEACLALWRPGDGFNRYTGILADIVLPDVVRRVYSAPIGVLTH